MTLLWKPLLSATLPMDPTTGDFDYSLIPFPVYASVKMDGFRAMVQQSTLVGRNGLPIRNKELQTRYGRPECEGLDGELTDGPANSANVFNRTSKTVTKAGAISSAVVFNVIDLFWVNDEFANAHINQRLKYVEVSVDVIDKIVPIKQTLVRTVEQLKKFESKALAAGWEGVMLRRTGQGAYPQKTDKSGKPLKENRSTLKEFYLCRMKRFEYEFAAITAIHPLEHNANEERTGAGRRSSKKAGIVVDASMIGSATLRDCKTGKEFNTNVSRNALRAWPGWKNEKLWKGMKVRYRYQVCGTVEKPRINTCGFEELLP